MAIEKLARTPFKGAFDLSCDVCSSSDIIETKEGYVCRSCGIVLEIQRLEHYRPYNENSIQYAVLGTTQIGSVRERFQHSNSNHLNNLNRLHSIKSNKEAVYNRARLEISRIFTGLNLPDSYKNVVFEKFKKVHSAVKPGTKYRSPDKLVPICIHYVLKANNIWIKESDLLEVSKINKKEFNSFKFAMNKFLPKYGIVKKQESVVGIIYGVVEAYRLDMPMFHMFKRIVLKGWNLFSNTKDTVIAGVAISIGLLTSQSYDEIGVSINSICKELGIRPSTIQSQIKKKLIERFKIYGFTTLMKSTDIIRAVVKKLGLIEITDEIVEIMLGNAVQTNNYSKGTKLQWYAIKESTGLPILVSLKIQESYEEIQDSDDKNIEPDFYKRFFELKITKFMTGKDPPTTFVNPCQ